MANRIKKVKFKPPTVEVHIEEHLGKSVKESIFKCTEDPHPDFSLAFDRLVPFVFDILGLPRSVWTSAVKVTGVTFSLSEETGIEGAVITGLVALKKSTAPFCFNTPHLPFESPGMGPGAKVLDRVVVEALEILRAEARDYVDGSKRAQSQLEFSK